MSSSGTGQQRVADYEPLVDEALDKAMNDALDESVEQRWQLARDHVLDVVAGQRAAAAVFDLQEAATLKEPDWVTKYVENERNLLKKKYEEMHERSATGFVQALEASGHLGPFSFLRHFPVFGNYFLSFGHWIASLSAAHLRRQADTLVFFQGRIQELFKSELRHSARRTAEHELERFKKDAIGLDKSNPEAWGPIFLELAEIRHVWQLLAEDFAAGIYGQSADGKPKVASVQYDKFTLDVLNMIMIDLRKAILECFAPHGPCQLAVQKSEKELGATTKC